MIKFSAVTSRPVVRETTAAFEYNNESGETVVEEIRVRYFAHTTEDVQNERKKAREQKKAKKAKPEGEDAEEETIWLADILATKLESLPDIVDDKENPIAITSGNLIKLAVVNLRAIEAAIDKDSIVPKELPSK